MTLLNNKSLKFLEAYLNNPSPTGFESEGQKIWLKYIKPYIDAWDVDTYGTVYGIINPGKDYNVVIEGHADEISWFVNYITDKGFIHVIRNGGSDQMIAPSKRVNIHTKNGIVKGVFGWPAIHTRSRSKESNPSPTIENIFIDVGANSKDEVEEMGIKIGCVITYEDQFMILNDNLFVGRALDNRIGGFCIAEVARLIHKNKIKLPYTLYIVNSVQEEVGLRGAQMVAETIRPKVAIVTDVTHDTHTPHISTKKHGDVKIGKGPCIAIAPSIHNTLRALVEETAEENKIPIQRAANSRSTGTDADAFAYANGGIATSLISLPLRYMHTTVEMAHKSDVEQVIKLIYESLRKIKKDQSFRYL